MSITERQKIILNLVNEYKYISVQKLAALVYTSPSSIRRDLTTLENMFYLKRTHGGAQSLDGNNQPPNFNSRVTRNTAAKRKIAQSAAVFLRDNQCIMLDSSSTAGYLLPHISKHKNVTLFTNNMITAMNAVNYGIPTYCSGGFAHKNSPVLASEDTYKALSGIHPDILFFSSFCIDSGGNITDPTAAETYAREIMLKNSAEKIFLCDSEKFNRRSTYTLTSADDIDACVFDAEYSALKCKCRIIV